MPLIVGPIVASAGFAILGWGGRFPSFVGGFLPGLIVVAIGMTITIAPLTTTVFDSSPNEMSGIASGVNNAAARAGSLVAIAALGVLYSSATMDSSHAAASSLAIAYVRAMIAAAVLAGLSALAAALTIRAGKSA
jgi:hypothetical protein